MKSRIRLAVRLTTQWCSCKWNLNVLGIIVCGHKRLQSEQMLAPMVSSEYLSLPLSLGRWGNILPAITTVISYTRSVSTTLSVSAMDPSHVTVPSGTMHNYPLFAVPIPMCHGHTFYEAHAVRLKKDANMKSIDMQLSLTQLHDTILTSTLNTNCNKIYLILVWIECSTKAFRGVMRPSSPKAVQEPLQRVQFAIRVGMHFVGEVVPTEVWESLLHTEGQFNLHMYVHNEILDSMVVISV